MKKDRNVRRECEKKLSSVQTWTTVYTDDLIWLMDYQEKVRDEGGNLLPHLTFKHDEQDVSI